MGSKRKHHVLNIETKIEIIEKLEKGESGSSLAQFYNVVKQEQECKGRKGKVLFLLDNAPSQPSVEKLNMVDPHFKVMFFPANTTAIIQLMDQGIIVKLKRTYRKQILRRLLLTNEENVINFYRNLNLKDAYQEKQEITEITNLLKSIPRLEVNNEVDVKDWLENNANDLGFEILNDDEIVEAVTESELPSEIENEYEDAKKYTGPTPGEAFTLMESAMQWYEQQPECNTTELLLLKRIKALVAKKRNSLAVQKKKLIII
ncbi:hypothetical protein QTP88_027243 [Uroleucon formosanum]